MAKLSTAPEHLKNQANIAISKARQSGLKCERIYKDYSPAKGLRIKLYCILSSKESVKAIKEQGFTTWTNRGFYLHAVIYLK